MKVLFYVNYPLAWAPGGHAIKIRQIQAGLERLGVAVEWLSDSGAKLQEGDLIQYWSRPPNDLHWKLAQGRGLKVAVQELLQVPILRGGAARWLRARSRSALRRLMGDGLYGTLGLGVYPACDAAIAVTEPERRYMVEVYGAPENRVSVIPDGARAEFFARDAAPVARHDRLIHVGYVCERKNVLPVARAAKAARVPVLFVGDALIPNDPYFAEFKREVDDRFVFWMPPEPDPHALRRLIQGSQGLVLASQNEGVPLVLLEALAAGAPVLGPDLPSVRSYFGAGIRYGAPPDQPRFVQDLRKFYDECRGGLKQSFRVPAWDEAARQYADVYRKVLGA